MGLYSQKSQSEFVGPLNRARGEAQRLPVFGTPARLYDAARRRSSVARTDFTLRPCTKGVFKL